MRPINEIIIHCTATRPEWWAGKSPAEKVAEVRRWHTRDRGWSDIGYHYLIDRDGTVMSGRPVTRIGAHVQGHNTGTIGVSLFGGHGSAETDDFSDNFTPAQEAALRRLLDELQARFPAVRKISGHNEYAAKACPGFSVPLWLLGANGYPHKFVTPTHPRPPLVSPRPAQRPSWVEMLASFLKGER